MTSLGGKTLYYTYDENKQLKTVSDSLGLLHSFTYDDDKRLATISDAASTALFSAEYDIYGRATIRNEGPSSSTQIFDLHSGLAAYTDEHHLKTTQAIDSLCRLTQLEDSLNRTIQINYEGNSLFPSKIQDPLGQTTQYFHDDHGNLSAITRPDGSTKKFWYDQNNRLTLSQDGKGNYTLIRYDDQDRVILQARACQIEFTAEGANYDTSKGQTITFTYEENHLRPSSIRVSDQKPHYFEYYPNGQLAKAYFPEGKDLRFVYDARCRLFQVYENGEFSFEYTYNERDLITSIFTLHGKTTYERDLHGNIIALIDAKNRKTFFDYDAYHRLTQIIDAEGGVTTYHYDRSSHLEEIIFPEGSKRFFRYDGVYRLREEL